MLSHGSGAFCKYYELATDVCEMRQGLVMRVVDVGQPASPCRHL